MKFQQKWKETVQRKNSLLCVGIDPWEPSQRPGKASPFTQSKLGGCLRIVEEVAPFAAAVKMNRNYIKDFSREDTQKITSLCKSLDLVTIDDSKIADIGSTNDSAFYHARQEGFDAVTYAPFPGNVEETTSSAHRQGLGLIVLVLMSNPEYEVIKDSSIGGMKGYEYLATQARNSDADGVVLGAPSRTNHLREEEIRRVSKIITDQVILVPGLGAQEGDAEALIRIFGDRVIANVGRTILYGDDPAEEARKFRDLFNQLRGRRESN